MPATIDVIIPLLATFFSIFSIICFNFLGIDDSTAADLLLKNGPNRLTPQKQISMLALYLRQYLNMLWILLIIAGLNKNFI